MPPGDDTEDEGAPLFPGLFGRMTGAARRRGQRILGVPGNDVIAKFEKAVTRFEKAVSKMSGTGGSSMYPSGNGGDTTIRNAPSAPGVHRGDEAPAGSWRERMKAEIKYDPSAFIMAARQIGGMASQAGGSISGYFGRQRDPMMALEGMASMGSNFGYGSRSYLMNNNASIWGGDVAGHVAIQNAAQRSGNFSIMKSMGFAGSINPLIDQSAVAAGYQGMFSSASLRAMVPFGGAAVMNGGKRNGDYGDILNRYITATTGGQGAGQMSQKEAVATFGLGGQGRATLSSYFGLDDNTIDLVQQYAAGSARAGRRVDLNNEKDVIKYLGNDFNASMQRREGRGLKGDIAMHEGTREGQKDVADALGLLEEKAKGAASALGSIIPYGGVLTGVAGKLIGVVGDLGGALATLKILGGGGGSPGVPGGGLLKGGMGLLGRGLAFGGEAAAAGAGAAGITALASGVAGFAGSKAVGHFTDNKLAKVGGGIAGGAATGAAFGLLGGPFAEITVPGGAIVGGIIGGIGGLFGDPADDTEMDRILGEKYHGQWTNLNPAFRKKLAAMFRANPKLTLSSGWRSTEQQRHLYNEWRAGRHKVPSVARPGHSNHEKGLAADVGPESEYSWLAANAAKYGLTSAAVKNEPWHVEPIGAKNMASSTASSGGMSESSPAGVGGSFTVKQGSLAYSLTNVLNSHSTARLGSGGGGGMSSLGGGSGSDAGASGPIGNQGLVDLLRSAGFSGQGLRTAYAVAMAESGGRPTAHNTNAKTGDNSYGLFQINMLGRMGPARRKQYGLSSNDDLLDPAANARVAFQMSGGGSNWGPWSTYKSGAYKKYLNADIGDPAEGGGVVMRSGGGNQVTVHLTMPLQVVKASESEAQRLVEMVATKLEHDARIKMLGGV